MICAIITPVGPGHAALFEQACAPSVERAKAYDMGDFSEILHYRMDDGEGLHGRSTRRNQALERARAAGVDWVFFLDADDQLSANAFEAFARSLKANPSLEAIWGLICEFDPSGAPQLREGQPEQLRNRAEFLSTPPVLALQIGAFIRCDVAARTGFDVDMDVGEDFKFFYQLWAKHVCAKVPEIFFINQRGQHSHGPRAATGVDWSRVVSKLWQAELGKTKVYAQILHGDVGARMRLTNPNDLIQKTHLSGRFFESDSLEKLRPLVTRPNPHILEVGANIGNHVVWYAQHLKAAKIYPVEPNPAALTLLNDNIEINNLEAQIDRRGFGLGAGNAPGRFSVHTEDADNLGASQLRQDATGDIEVETLDRLMGAARVDLIKIDAEGMEIAVLEGAAALIARERPVIWVEVLRANMLDFVQGWCRTAGYRIADSTAYINTIDYFVTPKQTTATATTTATTTAMTGGGGGGVSQGS